MVAVDILGKGAEAAAKAAGGESGAVRLPDIGDPEQVAALPRRVGEKAGRLDVQVNAAAMVPCVKWDELNFEEWRRIMRVDLDGLYFMCARRLGHNAQEITAHRQHLLEFDLRRHAEHGRTMSPRRAG